MNAGDEPDRESDTPYASHGSGALACVFTAFLNHGSCAP
jgi:hypothetical protein